MCARCTGIWLGYVIGFPVALFISVPWYLIVILALPALLDGGTQLLRWRSSTNTLRLITGVLAGIGEMILLVWLARWVIDLGYTTGNLFI